MTWKEKIKKGMELIGEGCNGQRNSFAYCNGTKHCPFANYCWVILEAQGQGANISAPWYWDEV